MSTYCEIWRTLPQLLHAQRLTQLFSEETVSSPQRSLRWTLDSSATCKVWLSFYTSVFTAKVLHLDVCVTSFRLRLYPEELKSTGEINTFSCPTCPELEHPCLKLRNGINTWRLCHTCASWCVGTGDKDRLISGLGCKVNLLNWLNPPSMSTKIIICLFSF